jgi:hypothetical protein
MIDVKSVFKNRSLRQAGMVMMTLMIVILTLETGLNLWIRSALTAGLHKGNDPDIQVNTSISWLGIKDLLQGRVGWIRMNARNCKINNLKYSRFQLDNQGFSFNLPVLLKEGSLQITTIQTTQIKAVISEKALEDYLNLEHPGYGLGVGILADKILIRGRIFFLGNKVPVEFEGGFTNNSTKMIRFHPLKLSIANHPVSYGLLELIGNQLPLEFPIMEDWPLRITQIRLTEGNLSISLRELNSRTKR